MVRIVAGPMLDATTTWPHGRRELLTQLAEIAAGTYGRPAVRRLAELRREPYGPLVASWARSPAQCSLKRALLLLGAAYITYLLEHGYTVTDVAACLELSSPQSVARSMSREFGATAVELRRRGVRWRAFVDRLVDALAPGDARWYEENGR